MRPKLQDGEKKSETWAVRFPPPIEAALNQLMAETWHTKSTVLTDLVVDGFRYRKLKLPPRSL